MASGSQGMYVASAQKYQKRAKGGRWALKVIRVCALVNIVCGVAGVISGYGSGWPWPALVWPAVMVVLMLTLLLHLSAEHEVA